MRLKALFLGLLLSSFSLADSSSTVGFCYSNGSVGPGELTNTSEVQKSDRTLRGCVEVSRKNPGTIHQFRSRVGIDVFHYHIYNGKVVGVVEL